MFAVHSFATHSSAAAFRLSSAGASPSPPSPRADVARARRPPPIVTWLLRNVARRTARRTPTGRVHRLRPRNSRATARRACRPTNASPRPTDPHPTSEPADDPISRIVPSSATSQDRPRLRGAQVRAGTISTNDFKVGVNVEVDNALKVVEFMHVKPGKGSAFVRSKLKNYLTKSTNEKTFRAGEKLQTADVEKRTMQYTYKDGEQFVMMDMETYEETRVDEDDFAKFLLEGTTCEVLSWNGKVIGVELPINVELEVVMTDPGVKGNTASGGDKPAEVETGATVTVPLFIQIGEKISRRHHHWQVPVPRQGGEVGIARVVS